jgi:hypothetical protein
VKVTLQLEQLIDRSLRRRVDALFREWKFRRVPEHVHVAVTGAARHIEIDGGAPRGASGGADLHRPCHARGRPDLPQHCASREHCVALRDFFRSQDRRGRPNLLAVEYFSSYTFNRWETNEIILSDANLG